VRPARFAAQAATAPAERLGPGVGETLPNVAALPNMGAAQPPTGAPQPPTGASQPSGTRRTPSTTPPDRATQRDRQPQSRPAIPVDQQIEFDPKGLVQHFHVNEGDLRQILELLSRRAGMNILVSPKVGGTVTVNFENVTVEQVLKAVIRLANLVEKTEGTFHYIYTKGEIQDEAEVTKKERIITKVYKLSYVRADEVLGIIRPFLSADVGRNRISVTPSYRFGISESATFVSGGGQAMTAGGAAAGGGAGTGGPGGSPPSGGGPTIGGFQPPTGGNSLSDFDHLIIQDYESNLRIIDQIIQRIDVRPIQVLIEAVIVSVDFEHDRELGVNFGVVDNLAQTLGTIGTGTALNGNVGFTPTKLLTTAGKIAQSTAATDPQGFTSAVNGIKFGFVANNVTGFVRALETIGSTKILASPRILVLNKQRAEIQLGARLGFQTLSQNFTSTIQQVQFLNTGTLLRLRPFVSDDGMVRMEIHPERSSGVVNNNIPNQQTAELTTNVMIPDGATLVIGGLMEDEDDYQLQGLPLLSRLPALGYLFGNRVKTEGRRELVVLLTPHIWSPEQAMALAPAPHGPPGLPGAATSFELATGPSVPDSTATAPALTATAPDSAPSPAAPRSTAPAARAAPLAAAVAAAPSAGQPAPVPPATSGVESPPASVPSGEDRTASSPTRRRPWPSLRQLWSRRGAASSADPPSGRDGPADPRSQDPRASRPVDPRDPLASPQAPVGPAQQGPDTGSAPAGAAPPGITSAAPTPRRDPMLARAGWEPGSIAGAEPDQRSPRSRSQSRAAVPWRPAGLRPGAVTAGPRRHTVAIGETFPSLARLYYGSDRYAGALRQFNRGRFSDPRELRAGDLS